MSIDWFTFTAQIVNFLVLVWLLKRFLYAPLVAAMNQREETIAARVQAADQARSDAEQAAARHNAATAELKQTQERLLEDARRDVELWKDEQTRQARREVERAREDWFTGLSREQDALIADLSRQTSERVQQLSEVVLKELSNTTLQSQVIEVFLQRLQQLGGEQRAEILAAISDANQPMVVESAFEISAAEQQRIADAIGTQLDDTCEVKFRLQPELICGIQVRLGNYKVAWTAAGTFQSLQNEFARALQRITHSGLSTATRDRGKHGEPGEAAATRDDPETTADGGTS